MGEMDQAGRVAGVWLAFAKTGNPNTKGVPVWPAYNKTDRSTMILDTKMRVVKQPDQALLDLFS